MGVLLAHAANAPSAWVTRFAPLIAAGGTVLDVACGQGRHVRWLAAHGWRVTGVDRDEAALDALRGVADIIVADIEAAPWPLPQRCFDGVVVTNYLWRALLPTLKQSLASGGVLIYETFADGHQHIGRPTRPDFLLQNGELLQAFAGLRVVAFEDGYEQEPARFVQRLVAVRQAAPTALELGSSASPRPRYSLGGLTR